MECSCIRSRALSSFLQLPADLEFAKLRVPRDGEKLKLEFDEQ